MQLAKLAVPVLLCTTLLSTTLLSGCSLFSGEEDVVKISPLPKVDNQFTPKTVWSASVGSGSGRWYINLHPAWQDNSVFAASRDGTVVALNASDGKKRWTVSLAEKGKWLSGNHSALLSGGITVDGDHLYIGSEKAQVYALNTADGSLLWQTTVAGEAISRPVVSDGLVLIHTGNGILQALDVRNGDIHWTVNLDLPLLSLRGESAPAVAFGAAVVGGDNGRVSAILLEQGQLIWQQSIGTASGTTEIDRLSDVDSSPVVKDGVVYAVAYNGNLAALDLRSGQIIWKRDIGSVQNFIVDTSIIYLTDQTGRVLAIDSNNGTTLWQQTGLQYRGLTAPVIYQNSLVIADAEGYVHWLNPASGLFIAQQKLDGAGFIAAPVEADDKLLLQAKGGKLYAISH